MPKRTTKKALATRDRLLNTAERVFEKKGVSRTTLEDIATAAGMTRGAIYGHFKNKDELVADMFSRSHLPMDNLYPEIADNKKDPISRLRKVFVFILKEVSSNRRGHRVLYIIHHKCEISGEMKPILTRYRTLTRRVGRLVRTVVKNAIDQGELPASLDLARAETMFHAILTGLIHNWTLTPNDFNLNNDAEALVNGYIDMLRLSPALSQRTSADSWVEFPPCPGK